MNLIDSFREWLLRCPDNVIALFIYLYDRNSYMLEDPEILQELNNLAQRCKEIIPDTDINMEDILN